MTKKVMNASDIEALEFQIEDNVPVTRYGAPRVSTNPLFHKVYNAANKLTEGQSFLVPVNLFENDTKASSFCYSVIQKLVEINKKNGHEVAYKRAVIKDAELKPVSIRIWRIKIVK